MIYRKKARGPVCTNQWGIPSKRLGWLGTALTAALIFAAMPSTPAYALPEFLPSTGANKSFTGTSTSRALLETAAGKKIQCSAGTSSGGLSSDSLGTFHFTFTSCKEPSLSIGCESSGDSKEVILALGTYHFVYDELGTGETLGTAILLSPSATKFECSTLVKGTVMGTLLCPVLRPLTSSLTHEFSCIRGLKNGQQQKRCYWNDGGTVVDTQLLVELNGGKDEESNEQVSVKSTTSEAGAWMNE